MSIFKRNEKAPQSDSAQENAGAENNAEELNEVIKRLSSYAGSTIAMLKDVLKTDKGLNYNTVLLYAAGLAGYSCQQAVIANNDKCAVVDINDGRNYYFGDGVNAYLLENRTSVFSFMRGIYEHKTGKKAPDPTPAIKLAVSLIGDGKYKIWNCYTPDEAYNMIKNCWDGIFDNMTGRYCKNASEWPIFFAIVLQNIMADGMVNGQEDAVYFMTLECMLFISKMRDDSLLRS